jgi:hypothetical protein
MHSPNSSGSPADKLASILQGEYRNMDTGIYWEVFENTGSVEAFLTYYKTEEVSSDSSANSEESESKSFEGDE